MLEQRIQQHFFDGADLHYQLAEPLSKPLADVVHAVVGCLTAGGKVLLCGLGPSHATAQALATQLVGRFERDRPGLAAIVLGGDAAVAAALVAGDSWSGMQARLVHALGVAGDLLIVWSAEADASALVPVVAAAHGKDIAVAAITGRVATAATLGLTDTDVHVAVPHDRPARVREIHLLAAHAIGDAVDLQLLGEQDDS
jgi:D-sedoheptulose 7-phosphate isomerase